VLRLVIYNRKKKTPAGGLEEPAGAEMEKVCRRYPNGNGAIMHPDAGTRNRSLRPPCGPRGNQVQACPDSPE
jgi:hypothetical protein